MRSLFLLATLLLPVAAWAGPSLSLRLAVAPALRLDDDRVVAAGEGLAGQVPLQLDALWRLGPFSLGAYGSAALGWAEGGCEDGADCGATAWRVGLEGLLDLPRLGRAVPWVGAGAGWAWTSRSRERLGSETSMRWSSPEVHAQAGASWRVREGYTLGPYALVALGSYRTVTLETSEASASAPVPDPALHVWFHLGVRATLDL